AASLGEALEIDEAPAVVEAPPEPAAAVTAAIPLAQVRAVFASAQIKDAIARKKWRFAAIIAVAAIGLTLLSVYGWRAWYKASVASQRTKTASPQVTPSATANAAAGAGFAGTPDVVYPEARPGKLSQPHSAGVAAVVEIPDEVVRREFGGTIPLAGRRAASTGTPSAAIPNSPDIQVVAASSAAAGDPGSSIAKAIQAPPVLPTLSVPISQGTSGGVLLRKVQPVYPVEARRMHMAGSVVIDAVVNVEGQVDDLKLVSGEPLLSAAAMDAVRKWQYSPYLLNGKPIPRQTRITISFIAPQ
ncbi:MAG: energy transducer TonB, partial [Terriglobales bacterium]